MAYDYLKTQPRLRQHPTPAKERTVRNVSCFGNPPLREGTGCVLMIAERRCARSCGQLGNVLHNLAREGQGEGGELFCV